MYRVNSKMLPGQSNQPGGILGFSTYIMPSWHNVSTEIQDAARQIENASFQPYNEAYPVKLFKSALSLHTGERALQNRPQKLMAASGV